jgi:hypothetical protein
MKKTALASLVLLLATCVFLDTVEQPSQVVVGELFTIRVTGTIPPAGGSATGFIGLMLPDGVQVDSGRYTDDRGRDTLMTEPDDSLCVWLEESCPCETCMHWMAFSHRFNPDPDTATSYEALVYARVTDLAVPGRYLVDYRTGHSYPVPWLLSDSIMDQPMTVIDTTVGDDVGMDAILAPVGGISGDSIVPIGRIINLGGTVINEVTCYCWIDSLHDTTGTRVYDEDTVYSDPLSPFDTASISFVPPWDPGLQGSYAVTMFTVCQGDSNCANDTLYDTLAVVGIAGDERPNVSAQWCEMLPTQGAIRLRGQEPAALLDAVGRKVMDLQPGINDIRHLSPGIYLLRSAASGDASGGGVATRSAVGKVIVTR